MFLIFPRFPLAFICSCTYVRGSVRAKKLAKVLLFFELTKFFLKKMQKKCKFLRNAISACHFGLLLGSSIGVFYFFVFALGW